MRRSAGPILLLVTALALSCAKVTAPPDPGYVAQIESWRAERDARLRSATGWLSLIGLHWLEPGPNRFGWGADNEIRLPEGRGPGRAGVLVLEGERITLHAEPGAGVLLNGEPASNAELRSDAEGSPDELVLDDMRLYVIKRGDRFALRIKDPRSPVLAAFEGMEYFPVDSAYRVEGTWIPYDQPREVEIPTVLGSIERMLAPGRVEFSLRGELLTLEPVVGSPDDAEYFFIFKDETAGRETYGAGRFLYTDREREGRLLLDFNKAYNPPCVFTPYATCPLPPKQNQLTVRIEAGEKVWRQH